VSDALPSLIIAGAELSVVSLLRGAINANLPKTGPLGTIPPNANPATPQPQPKLAFRPADKFEPRHVVHPEPRFEPRPVIHPTPRTESVPPQYVTAIDGPKMESTSDNPIQPPWRKIPWTDEPQLAVEVNVVKQSVDLIHKGTLLDLFV
jgi:hypothetical protein